MHPTVLVTGARGLLGSALLEVCKQKGYVVHALAADVRDEASILKEVVEISPQYVVHAAAIADVAACEREPERAEAVHVKGTAYVRDAAEHVGAKLFYISTASVFSGATGNYKEYDEPEPHNVYNITKRKGELETLSYDKGAVIRLNVIGIHKNGSRGKNFIEWLVDSFATNKDMKLFGDQYINPLSNWTIAEMVSALIENGSQEKIIHLGSSNTLSKAEIGALVHNKFPTYTGTITVSSVDSISDGAVRPKQMWLNTDQMAKLLGPMPTLEGEVGLIFSKRLSL